jgi:hypothetical protein
MNAAGLLTDVETKTYDSASGFPKRLLYLCRLVVSSMGGSWVPEAKSGIFTTIIRNVLIRSPV